MSSGRRILLLHAALFFALLLWSWRKWPDPLIDFGRELYVPWQLTQGKVLYRDIDSLFGPLSVYVNAAWMRLFGVSLMNIAMCNAAIFAGILAGIHHYIRVATDKFTASAATLTALALCGFCQYDVEVGNYNFITPYAHEATHGLALAVVILLVTHRAMAASQPLLGALAGVCFGLLLMTKPEVPVAVLMAVTIGVIGYATLGSSERRSAAAMMLMFGAGSLLGPVCFWTYFRAHMQPSLATRSVAAAWLPVFNSAILNNAYYLQISGLDKPARNIALMVLLFAGALATIWIAARLSSTKSSRRSPEIKDAGRVAVLAVLAPVSQLLPVGRTLPLIGLAALAVAIRLFWKHRHNRHDAIRHLALVMWCTFSVAMLAKMALRATILHYGFYLALPAVTVAVISICWIVPGFLDRWRPGSAAREFRWFATLAVAAVILPLLLISQQRYATKRLEIGGGGDRFYGSNVADGVDTPQAILAREALQTILQDAKTNDTLAVLPEGVMLNYLSRLESPLRVVTVMPPELLTFGERSIIQSLEAAPPTFVVFVHRTTGEYGLPLFGTDPRYGLKTMDWVKARYRSIRTLGSQPLTESGYGIEIFKAISDQAEAQKSPYAAGWRRSN